MTVEGAEIESHESLLEVLHPRTDVLHPIAIVDAHDLHHEVRVMKAGVLAHVGDQGDVDRRDVAGEVDRVAGIVVAIQGLRHVDRHRLHVDLLVLCIREDSTGVLDSNVRHAAAS